MQALSGGRLRAQSMSGTGDTQLQVAGDPRQRLEIKGDIKFKAMVVNAPEFFAVPLDFGDGQLLFDLDWQPTQTVFSRLQLTSGDLK
jgi:hypothetical protein